MSECNRFQFGSSSTAGLATLSIRPIVNARQHLLLRPRLIRQRALRRLLGGERRGCRLLVGLHGGIRRLLAGLGVSDRHHITPELVPAHEPSDLERAGHAGER